MRSASPALQALLSAQQFIKCNLYTLTLINSHAYFWTDADVDVVAGGTVYSSSGAQISGASLHLMRGLQVDTLTLKVLVNDSDTIAGQPWSIAARSGALDGATVSVGKAFLRGWGAPAESLNFFKGKIVEVSFGELEYTLKVVSDADRLNTQTPRLTFQPGCVRSLFDAGCGINAAPFRTSSNVVSSSNRASFLTSLTKPDGYYALGTVLFNSGLNAGVRRAIKSCSASGSVELSQPLNFNLSPGDSFTITAGCDKSRGGNGCAKFSNVANFKGFPFIPTPEALL